MTKNANEPSPTSAEMMLLIAQQMQAMREQVFALRRIADALETLAAIAQAEHEASDTGDIGPAFDLSGRPV